MYEEVILPRLIAVGVASVSLLLVGFLVGRFFYPRCPSNPESYYRGLFDSLPVWEDGDPVPDERLLKVRGAVDRGWYGQSSDGWRWPLPLRAELDPLGESGGTVDRVGRG